MEDKEYKDLTGSEKIQRQKEIWKLFTKLGFLAFGGPAAHIAMLETEAIEKKKWLGRDRFMDFMGATNIIPGPNSTEMVMLVGYERGGIIGLFNAGASFILPAMFLVLMFGVMYVTYGSLPELTTVLDGVKAVIMAVIINALYRLFKNVIRTKWALGFGLAVAGIYLLGVDEIPLLFVAGFIMMVWKNKDRITGKTYSLALPMIFLTFLKIGAVLYGSGYVLLAFLEAEFVETLGVLTEQQILDSVAVGQFTPGPVFTTATFIGYILGGFPGAVLATIGIFLPAFVLVAFMKPFIYKLRENIWLSGALDGVNIASLVLMAVVSVKLGVSSIFSITTAFIFIGGMIGIMKYNINTAWLIIAGGLINWLVNIV
ncbi:chromate transporter [Gudongella sp. DL1XJH-153]|uniref:chromate transporter n=1 Tax=Gudongella sp. DL1XJH-153 TaxID=3409804 RepID=UPI003BB670EE